MAARAGGTLAEATSACQTLSLGGFASGWRVPTVKELLTLTQFWGADVDAATFPSAPTGKYWTSSQVAAAVAQNWAVDFHPSPVGAYNSATPTSESHAVRCVH